MAFQLFQYFWGSGLGTIGDFSSLQLLHDPLDLGESREVTQEPHAKGDAIEELARKRLSAY